MGGLFDKIRAMLTPAKAEAKPEPLKVIETKQPATKDWKTSPAHLLLLSAYAKPRAEFTDGQCNNHGWDEWKHALRESPRTAFRRFVDEGFVAPSDLAGKLDYGFKVTELKPLLKEAGLSVSGKKQELIARLIESAPQTATALVKDWKIFQCSEQGLALVAQYNQSQVEAKKAMELQTIAALQARNFRQAAEMRTRYEADQVFARGMGIDWSNHDVSGDVKLLRYIFDRTPKVLRKFSDADLLQARVAAGMFALGWNVGQAQEWIATNINKESAIIPITAGNLLFSHAHFLNEIEEAKELASYGSKMMVVIQTNNDDRVCESCRALASQKYSLRETPELPNENCTCESGCRCWVSCSPNI